MKTRKYKPAARYRQRVVTRSKFRFERRKQATKVFLFLLIAGLIGTISWWTYRGVTDFLFRSENFKIQKVEIRGINNLSQSEILALLPFRNGDNIFSFDASDVEAEIARSKPELKNIDVGRGWKKVTVSVEERRPVAFVNIAGERLGLDADNKPFPLRGSWAKEFLPEITRAAENERRTLLSFIRALVPKAKEYSAGVLKFDLEPVDRVILVMKDGSKVFWGPYESSKVEPKLKRLTQVLEEAQSKFQAIEYINLSFFDDGRILVKPRAPSIKVFKKG